MKSETKNKEIGALEICLKHIKAAGGVPNHRFYAALRAARALDAAVAEEAQRPPPEGSDYLIVATNGREYRRFVAKGGSVFRVAKAEGIEVASFSKV